MATLNLTQINQTRWEWDDGEGLTGEVKVSPNARNPEANAKTLAARDYHASGGVDRNVYFDQIITLSADEIEERDSSGDLYMGEQDRADCAMLDAEEETCHGLLHELVRGRYSLREVPMTDTFFNHFAIVERIFPDYDYTDDGGHGNFIAQHREGTKPLFTTSFWGEMWEVYCPAHGWHKEDIHQDDLESILTELRALIEDYKEV